MRAKLARVAALGAVVIAVAAQLACGSETQADSGSSGTGGADEDSEAGGSSGFSGYAASSALGGSDAGADAPAKLGPPYPIVLAHGFFGFEEFAGLDFATYFYGVKAHLAETGELLVYTPAVDPFNDSSYRGEQLIERIESILAETGHAKVNIIGHSQGGLDARVVAYERPDLVASVTTIATPHQGTPIADIVLGLVSNPDAQKFIDWLVKMAAAPLYDQAGEQTSLSKPMLLFSKQGIADFNATYDNRASVRYYSLAGRSDWELATTACKAESAPAFVSLWQDEKDPVDPLLALTEALLDGGLADPYPNDGLVQVESAKWGRFLGCIPADHLDEIGHLFGDGPGLGNDWSYLDFYVSLVAFLRQEGL